MEVPVRSSTVPCKLSVNVEAIAYLRNRRQLLWPSVEAIGCIALAAGAGGFTVNPRPDERHIRGADVPRSRRHDQTGLPRPGMHIEGFPDEGFLKLVEANRPDQVTLVLGVLRGAIACCRTGQLQTNEPPRISCTSSFLNSREVEMSNSTFVKFKQRIRIHKYSNCMQIRRIRRHPHDVKKVSIKNANG